MKNLDHNENHPRINEVETIIERLDKGHFDYRGGYPSDWIIAGDLLIMASIDHKDARTNRPKSERIYRRARLGARAVNGRPQHETEIPKT
jgi:hypothetical protein